VFLGLGVALPTTAFVVPDAAAQLPAQGVICAKTKKKTGEIKKLSLQPGPECKKKKEERVLDLGELDDRASNVEEFAGTACSGDPNLAFVLYCEAHDGDQAACESSFQPEATACWYYRGKCLPCYQQYESITTSNGPACSNACESRPSCTDQSRTLFAGWQNTRACRDIMTQASCESAYAVRGGRQVVNGNSVAAVMVSQDGRDAYAVSCFWGEQARCNGGSFNMQSCTEESDCPGGMCTRCFGCGPNNEEGEPPACTNTCGTPPEPSCNDATRTEKVSFCDTGDPDEATCDKRYGEGGDHGLLYSCYWDSRGGGTCSPCNINDDLLEKCDNTCL
jgi:hypothetical protein